MRKADLSKDLSQVLLVGDISLPMLDSRIERNHADGAVYDHFLSILSPLKEAICMKDVGNLL